MKKFIALMLVLLVAFSLCACSESKQAEPKAPEATIINKNGETEYLTAADLLEINNGNSIAFSKTYKNAQVTLEAKVQKVNGACNYNGYPMNAYVELEGGWLVESTKGTDLSQLMPGDMVRITGYIFDCYGQVHIRSMDNYPTTITPIGE